MGPTTETNNGCYWLIGLVHLVLEPESAGRTSAQHFLNNLYLITIANISPIPVLQIAFYASYFM
jgi:hypothetical protein